MHFIASTEKADLALLKTFFIYTQGYYKTILTANSQLKYKGFPTYAVNRILFCHIC